MAPKITTDGQEMLLIAGEGNRGPWFVTRRYPFQAVEDHDGKYQGDADSILRDILSRLESCAIDGATITYVADEDVPENDRPVGLRIAATYAWAHRP